MDKTDLDIIRLLIDNSRSSYRRIADELGLSINTVRRRIERMLEMQVIRYSIIANLSNFGYDVIHLLIKQIDDMDAVLNRLQLVGNIYMIIRCLGSTYIIGLAIKDRKNSLELIKALLEPLRVTVLSYRSARYMKLTRNQIKMIIYLSSKPDASNKEIAKDLAISAKTVERNLDHLLNNDLIRFSILLDPSKLESYINVGLIVRMDSMNMIDTIYPIIQNNFLMKPIVYEDLMLAILYSNSIYWVDECEKSIRSIGVKEIEVVIALDVKVSLEWFSNNLKSYIREG